MSSNADSHRVVRRVLADGSVKEYRYPRKQALRHERYEADTIGALIIAYKQSPEWAKLKPMTKKNYGLYLRHLEDFHASKVLGMKRRDLLSIRDAVAGTSGNGAANVFIRVSTTLFAWARDHEWIEHTPLQRIKALPGGHLAAWTAEEADHASRILPEHLRRVVVLARYTGQRRGDLAAMMWSAYDGATVRVQQEKGSKPGQPRAALVIRAHPALRAELDAWRKTAVSTHILVTASGIPWKPNRMTQMMAIGLPKIGLRGELNVHGLRKLAAATLADAGCSAHEIAAVTGHRSLAMVQLYTASADQERLAAAAILRMEKAGEKKMETAGK